MSDREEAQDLRSVLAQVVTDSEAAEAETPAVTPAPGKPEPVSRETRERGPDGKFLAKEAASEISDEETPAESEEPAVETTEPEPPAAEVPAHWSQADKDLVAGLPKEHQAKVVERYKAIEAGFTPKLQRAAEIERQYQGAMQLFEPHVEGLRQRGQTPSDVIRGWAAIEQDMMSDRDTGTANGKAAQHVARMIQAYGIDPGAVAAILRGEAPGAQPNGNGAAAAVIPPQFVQQIQDLKARQDARDAADNRQRESSVQQQLEAFANEKDESGAVKHPYFSELERDMALLAQIEISQGKTPSIADLYDRAVYANRETRTKALAASQAEATRKAAAERKAKAEAANRAASSIAGSPGSGGSPAERRGPRTLREDLMDAAAEYDSA